MNLKEIEEVHQQIVKADIISEEPDHLGNLVKLYNQVKKIKNMHQCQENDRRVNELLSGLEKIVNSIANMRNNMSDAHGVGEKRIKVNAKEAKLVMNCSMTLCEYLVSRKKKRNPNK